MTDHETAIVIYNCYKRAMAFIVGRDIKPPAHTSLEKTYAYRYIRQFLKNIQGWNLSLDMIKALVREVVRYGKRHNILNKGLALLTMKSVLHICHDYLYNEETKTDVLIGGVKRSKEFIDAIANNKNIIDILVYKENPAGYTNFVKWFRQDNISIGFISLSANCRDALNILPLDEREELPSDIIILRNRIKILTNLTLKETMVNIMGSDITFMGVPSENR